MANLKTITKHEKLENIKEIPQSDMYFDVALKIEEKLNKLFKSDYEYSIWHKNGRHDVEVNYNGILFKYKYYINGKELKLEEEKIDN